MVKLPEDVWRGIACETVADLNAMTASGKIRELILVAEAWHEKQFVRIADMICDSGAKAVMLAGPSSSGKTTSAHRLATQLKVLGKKPVLISLDDYYIDRHLIAPGPDGTLDLEHINAIDIRLLRTHIGQLLSGKMVELPFFNFKTGKREWREHRIKLYPDSIILVEGLHGLNPVLLPQGLDASLIFKVYVAPQLPMNQEWIPESTLRLLRRIVRDNQTRGASVQQTVSMWDSVRRGEKRWIFPFREKADVCFNSATSYELAVLKKHIASLLLETKSDCGVIQNILKELDYIQEANVDDEIPSTSLIREFIGGNVYYKQ